MKKLKIIFITLLLFMFASCMNNNNIVPESYSLKQDTIFKTALDEIKIYKLKNEFTFDEIKNFPVNSKLNVIKWIIFKNINPSIKENIILIISESNKSCINKNLTDLLKMLNSNEKIYFSALYTKTNYGLFFEKILFYCNNNNKLYVISPLKDF